MHRALYVTVGKRGRQSPVAACNCNDSDNRLYVTDQHTTINFLVDSGAYLCVYTRSCLRERRTQTSYELLTANGIIVHTYDCIILRLDVGIRRAFSWRFVVANVTGSIKGSDLLCLKNLLVDIRHRRLIDISNLTVNGASVGTHSDDIIVLAESSCYHAQFQEFPDIIRPADISGRADILQYITFKPRLDQLYLRAQGG